MRRGFLSSTQPDAELRRSKDVPPGAENMKVAILSPTEGTVVTANTIAVQFQSTRKSMSTSIRARL